MDNVTIQNAVVDTALDIRELTTAELDGTGVLDTLLKTMRLHLDREFDNDRITGAAYVTTYTQIISAFLAQACNYALAKSKVALELTQLQAQIDLLNSQRINVEADTAIKDFQLSTLLPAEVHKIELETQLVEAQTLKLATETGVTIKQGDLVNAQALQTRAETNRINAEVGMKLPVEVANLTKTGLQIVAQTDNIESETAIKGYQLDSILPKEADQIVAQTNNTSATTVNVLKQGKLVNAQTCQVESQTAVIQAEMTLKLPEEVNLLKKQAQQSTAQSSYMYSQRETLEAERNLKLPAEVSLIQSQIGKLGKDTELTEAQLDIAAKEIILKEKEIAVQQSQANLYEQKKVTEVAQTSAGVIGAGSVLDHQNQLMKAQTDGFLRDAEQKAAKILVDTWSLRKNGDPDGNPENTINKLEDANVGKSIQKMLAGIGVII